MPIISNDKDREKPATAYYTEKEIFGKGGKMKFGISYIRMFYRGVNFLSK